MKKDWDMEKALILAYVPGFIAAGVMLVLRWFGWL